MSKEIRGLFFIPEHLREEIEGDLLQRFEKDVRQHGERIARLRLTFNIIKFFRPGILFRNKISIRPLMIRNYLKIAFRTILKQKSYSFLNIVGLSLGMAASLLILQYVKYERSFDTFHERAKDIYRLQYNVYHQNVLNFESAVAVPAVSAYLKRNFPEVEHVSKILRRDAVLSYADPKRGEIKFQEKDMFFAAPEFLEMFSYKVIAGNPATSLEGVDKLMLSQSTARKYFGDEDPMGKRITMSGTRSFEVTGIFEDVPENSHIHFDALISYETINVASENGSESSWGWYDFYTFVMLRPGTDVTQFQAKFDNQLFKDRDEEWSKRDARQEFIFRPLLDIHLKSNLLYEAEPDNQRDGDSVYALSIIALFILVIAWINYINLATARSFNRANEVGVRKVMGAFRQQLIWQFLTESFILNIIACVLALIIVRAGWPWFGNLSGWNIPLSYLLEKEFWMLVGGLFMLGVLLSGFYPAIVLSSFRPIAVLKGKLMKTSSGNFIRKSLVVFQFASSVFLIVGSIVVYRQLQFMKHQDLGMTINETLVLKGPDIVDSTYHTKYESFKNEINRIPGVKSIATASFVPGDEIYWTMNIRHLTGRLEENIMISVAGVDQDYIPSFGIEVLAGKNFDRASGHEGDRVIINLALSKQLSFKNPDDAIGKMVWLGGDTLEIAGVVEDFHQMSLKNTVAPLALKFGGWTRYYALKVETSDYQSVINAINEPWNTFFPGNPIDYFFLDEFFNKQYDKDDRFGTVFTLFTTLAIFIASLGLFGLASFMALQRTREIGIRKVLGSSVSGIVMLLAKGFLQPVIIANLIAWPLAWWVMDRWLQTFPYRISVNPVYFIVAGVLVIIIAFISVSSQTLRAAMTKPAETLKYE